MLETRKMRASPNLFWGGSFLSFRTPEQTPSALYLYLVNSEVGVRVDFNSERSRRVELMRLQARQQTVGVFE